MDMIKVMRVKENRNKFLLGKVFTPTCTIHEKGYTWYRVCVYVRGNKRMYTFKEGNVVKVRQSDNVINFKRR